MQVLNMSLLISQLEIFRGDGSGASIHEHAIVDVITEPMFLIGNHGKHINKKY